MTLPFVFIPRVLICSNILRKNLKKREVSHEMDFKILDTGIHSLNFRRTTEARHKKNVYTMFVT